MKWSIRLLYLYLFSFVGLLISIIGGIQIVDLTLKTYVFKVSEYGIYSKPMLDPESKLTIEQQEQQAKEMENQQQAEAANQRKRQFSNSLAMILVGAPVYLYHWRTIKKETAT